MTEDDLKEFLAANRDDINRQVKSKLIEGLIQQHRWDMSETIAATVKEFVTAEIIPEVKAHLTSEKSAILEACLSAASGVSAMIAEEMVKKAATNIRSNGYQFRKVMEEIFK